MHVFGAFELNIRPGDSDSPAGVKIALLRYTRGAGRAPVHHPGVHVLRGSGRAEPLSGIKVSTSGSNLERPPLDRLSFRLLLSQQICLGITAQAATSAP
jgi:hypothetical protein